MNELGIRRRLTKKLKCVKEIVNGQKKEMWKGKECNKKNVAKKGVVRVKEKAGTRKEDPKGESGGDERKNVDRRKRDLRQRSKGKGDQKKKRSKLNRREGGATLFFVRNKTKR